MHCTPPHTTQMLPGFLTVNDAAVACHSRRRGGGFALPGPAQPIFVRPVVQAELSLIGLVFMVCGVRRVCFCVGRSPTAGVLAGREPSPALSRPVAAARHVHQARSAQAWRGLRAKACRPEDLVFMLSMGSSTQYCWPATFSVWLPATSASDSRVPHCVCVLGALSCRACAAPKQVPLRGMWSCGQPGRWWPRAMVCAQHCRRAGNYVHHLVFPFTRRVVGPAAPLFSAEAPARSFFRRPRGLVTLARLIQAPREELSEV